MTCPCTGAASIFANSSGESYTSGGKSTAKSRTGNLAGLTRDDIKTVNTINVACRCAGGPNRQLSASANTRALRSQDATQCLSDRMTIVPLVLGRQDACVDKTRVDILFFLLVGCNQFCSMMLLKGSSGRGCPHQQGNTFCGKAHT